MTRFNDFIQTLVRNPEAHGRFLNTLSLLEYIGARKILKSQDEKQISMELLSHASEELRHARVFKKLAQEVGKKEFEGYTPELLYCGEEAKEYFKSVDSSVHEAYQDPHFCYGLTTLLVEERVLGLYPFYEEMLASLGYPGRILGILKEETKHMNEIEKWSAERQSRISPEILTALRAKEEEAFRKLMDAFERQVRHERLQASVPA